MRLRIVLAGDTMLGRGVAETLRVQKPESLVSPEVVSFARDSDFVFLNLECCISERGTKWLDPYKPFFFRAPPIAVKTLQHLGVRCVTLANNHALDFSEEGLLDTFEHLKEEGIAYVGAGKNLEEARAFRVFTVAETSLAIVAFSDHPEDYAAKEDKPGIAYADLRGGVDRWVREAVSTARKSAEIVLVSPHWGPNMVDSPLPYIRDAAEELKHAGATLIAGHSAHVFHGVKDGILYDLGDFLDDYATHPILRNDLGLLFRVVIEGGNILRIEALPLHLDYCYTEMAREEDWEWIRNRFTSACAEFGTEVHVEGELLVIESPNYRKDTQETK
ncbi:MAG TPA: CapA family protein [Fimbriimonadales bacterium]|nr:CapA family protein [Fimbriimonadales bacterium]